MKRRLVAMLAAAALLGAALVPVSSLAARPARTFDRVDVAKIAPELTPALLDPTRQVTVMVELAGKSVLQRAGESLDAGTPLTNAQKDYIRRYLRALRASVRPEVQAAGARIMAEYQEAYLGLKVRLAARDVASLARVDGVARIKGIQTYNRDLQRSVPYIGVPQAWTDTGSTGTGVLIAVIDSGIDYTHANFGGPGTPAAYETNDPEIIEPGTFPTAKVVGGFDFSGDDYDADGELGPATPSPDPDPLDCDGHGSHVAGIAAGNGVTEAGATYAGPYSASVDFSAFRVAPGVAPEAKILGLKVFGCVGSTNLVVDAIEAAAAAGADVINMSLGSPLGRRDDPSAIAANNAAAAGIVVVTSAGNSGPNAFITGSPGVASRVLSTAAIDVSSQTLAAAAVSDTSIILSLSNNEGDKLPITAPIKVLMAGGGISLGCDPAEYAGTAGTIVVTLRGVCDRVDRAEFGDAAGAVAVIMVNNAANYPPFEGDIAGVDIPFLGALQADGPALLALDGVTKTLSSTTIPNPGYQAPATFTSGGPREIDNALKPDISAPGVGIVSTGVGTGNGPATISGTSQASPHNTGVAALILETHPNWSPTLVKAAIMNTANAGTGAGGIVGYNPRIAGSGVTDALKAVQSLAFAITGPGQASLSFGYDPKKAAYSENGRIELRNRSSSPVTYALSHVFVGNPLGAAVAINPASVTVPAKSSVNVVVTLSLSPAALAALPAAEAPATGQISTIRGAILASPSAPASGIYQLRVPFLAVPRGLSNITAGSVADWTVAGDIATSSVTLRNKGLHAGNADVYAWGESDANDHLVITDIRATGVQALPGAFGGLPPTDRLLLFNVNFYRPWSSPSDLDLEIGISNDDDADFEFILAGVDGGAVTAAAFNGAPLSFLVDAASGEIVDAWPVVAPTNGSSYILIAAASSLGLSAGDGSFDYDTFAFSVHGFPPDAASGAGHFDAYAPALSQGAFNAVAPGSSFVQPLAVDLAAFEANAALGWLIATNDDPDGRNQAELVEYVPPEP
jgi:subtilisin family serine protease